MKSVPAAEPLITVVVPCRNRAAFLRATIDSILAQEYGAIECIVMDGGSSDGTVEILASYGERITWESAPDRGPFDAITKGWARGRGEFVAWLNADDTWAAGAAAAAAAAFAADPQADVVYGAALGIDDRGRIRYRFPPRRFDVYEAILTCDHVIMQAASFIRRRAVDAVGGLYPSWTHDQELWMRLGLAGARFVAVGDTLANIRVSAEDAHVNPAVMVPARLAMTRRLLALPETPRALKARHRRATSNTYLRGIDGLHLDQRLHWEWGARCTWGALRSDPANAPHIGAALTRLVRARLRPPYGV